MTAKKHKIKNPVAKYAKQFNRCNKHTSKKNKKKCLEADIKLLYTQE